MTAIPRGKSLNFLVFLASCSLQWILGSSDDSKDAKKPKTRVNSSSTVTTVVIVIILLIIICLFSFFLFKLWQRKRKEEHHARLMKLFEEDNELELELGLRE